MSLLNYPEIIKIEDVDIHIRVCSRSKHLKLRVSDKIELIIPRIVSIDYAIKFAESKRFWIKNHSIRIKPVSTKLPNLIKIWGREYKIIFNDKFIKNPIEEYEQNLLISSAIAENRVMVTLSIYLKKLFKNKIEEIVKTEALLLRVKYSKISIKDTKSRWGSCNSQGNITLSWRLIMAPYEVMRYVVIHELCHLIEMNHSKKFWKLVKNAMPEFAEARKWLKNNGKSLFSI